MLLDLIRRIDLKVAKKNCICRNCPGFCFYRDVNKCEGCEDPIQDVANCRKACTRQKNG